MCRSGYEQVCRLSFLSTHEAYQLLGIGYTEPHLFTHVLSHLYAQGYKWKSNAKYFKKPKTPVDPCSHWFPGHRPFEAPEVNNLANFITTLPNLLAFVDLRSYGQMSTSLVKDTYLP